LTEDFQPKDLINAETNNVLYRSRVRHDPDGRSPSDFSIPDEIKLTVVELSLRRLLRINNDDQRRRLLETSGMTAWLNFGDDDIPLECEPVVVLPFSKGTTMISGKLWRLVDPVSRDPVMTFTSTIAASTTECFIYTPIIISFNAAAYLRHCGRPIVELLDEQIGEMVEMTGMNLERLLNMHTIFRRYKEGNAFWREAVVQYFGGDDDGARVAAFLDMLAANVDELRGSSSAKALPLYRAAAAALTPGQ
jgi:hypothetical protein